MQNSVREIFSEVPKTYDAINFISTFGLDILWRKRLAKLAAGFGGKNWIDLCTGTGKTAIYLKNEAKNTTTIYAADFSLPMLKIAYKKPDTRSIKFILSDITKLPFYDNTFDIITMSFATRNINLGREILISTFREFRRVLKPGGHFLSLETSQPASRILQKLFHLYVKLIVRPTGSFISGSKKAYAYLSKTIPLFYNAEELKTLLEEAGFNSVSFKKLSFGIAAIHIAKKT